MSGRKGNDGLVPADKVVVVSTQRGAPEAVKMAHAFQMRRRRLHSHFPLRYRKAPPMKRKEEKKEPQPTLSLSPPPLFLSLYLFGCVCVRCFDVFFNYICTGKKVGLEVIKMEKWSHLLSSKRGKET